MPVSPKCVFLPTASGDDDTYIANFYAAFGAFTTHCSHLSLTRGVKGDPCAHILDQDVIYVGGRNARRMMEVWCGLGIDKALTDAWKTGVILTGLSAESLCWFSGSTADSWGQPFRLFQDGLGLLPMSHSPHYDSEPEPRVIFEASIARGDLVDGMAIDDHCGVLFRGQR